jgi:hypothetical protein
MRNMKTTVLAALVTWISTALAYAQINNNFEPASASSVEVTARLIGVEDQIEQLSKLSQLPAGNWQVISLRQRIYGEVLAAALEVDATTAQIDNEIAQASELRGYLADRRDRSVNRSNLLSALIGGGMSAASAGLQLPAGQTKPSAIVGIAGGTAASGLAVSGILEQKGRTQVFAFDSNMLAVLFDKPALPDSRYAPIVSNFLSNVAPTDPGRLTRKQRLIATWVALKRIDSPDSATGKDKINRVTSQPSQGIRLTIDDLEDRVAMLQDVRAKLSFLKRDLAVLLTSLPQVKLEEGPQ